MDITWQRLLPSKLSFVQLFLLLFLTTNPSFMDLPKCLFKNTNTPKGENNILESDNGII